MSWTKLQLVDRAFEEIGLASYTFDLNPDQYDSALRRLDAMMASWTLVGISLGYPIPDNPQDSALSEDSNITTNAQAVYTNLAVVIAPIIGKSVSSETKGIASKTYSDLLIAASLPSEMGFPGTLPKGQGQRSYLDSDDPFLYNSSDSGSSLTSAITYFTQLGDLIQGTGQNAYRILKNNIDATTAPGITDDEDSDYYVSSMWIDVSADQAYVCVDNTAGAAVWIETTAGASGGQTNTASNVGTGVGVFKQKTGVDLELNNLKSINNLVDITLNATTNDIEFTASQTNINAGVSITASQVSDFDTEVSNNSSVTANTAKVTNATHTGEVTGSGALTVADNVIDEANLKLETGPTNDYVLTADSTKSGGMKWAAQAGGGTVDTSGTPVANDFARFTDADTIEGRSYAETKSDLSLNLVENTALSTWAGSANITTLGTVSSGDVDAAVTDASVTAKGKVELATTAETTTGTDATRAVTPDGLKDGYIGSSNVTTLGTIATGTWQGTAIANTYIDSGIADNKIVEIDSTTVTSGEYAKFTANGLESKAFAEVKTDLSLNLVENTALSTWAGSANLNTYADYLIVPFSDQTTAFTTGTAKYTFTWPNFACTLTDISGNVITAPTGSSIIIDVNEGGTTIMTTNKIEIEVSETSSETATTQPVLTDTAIAANAIITIDIDQIGSTIAGAGGAVIFYFRRT